MENACNPDGTKTDVYLLVELRLQPFIAEVKQRQEKYKEELGEKPLHEQFKEQGILDGRTVSC